MASIIVITALGIFAVGVVVGIIVMVSHGIRREQRRYEEARRFREEHGVWDDPGANGNFLPEQAPDGVSFAARRFNGLYVRHLPAANRYDAELALRA
jgi:hypothetical protein